MSKTNVKKERPNTCVIYVRVSTEEQVRNFSLETQERECRLYAERNGWTVLRVYREEGESAKTADRTELKKIQEFCKTNEGKIGYLVVWKVNRFSRDNLDYFSLRGFFAGYGILLKSATEAIEETPQGRFSEAILAATSQYDNDLRKETSKKGMRTKAMSGQWPMTAPWGYKNVENEAKTKLIVPHPERAPIVKFLFEEYARGTTTFLELARQVNKMGDYTTKHGHKMCKQQVHRILTNPIYYGRIFSAKLEVDVDGTHEPIISEALYREVQEVMLGGSTRRTMRSRNNPEFPLRGVRCGLCGRSITGGFVSGHGGRYPYYGCYNKKCSVIQKQRRRSIPKEDLEKAFSKFLVKQTPNDKVMAALEEAFSVEHERMSSDKEKEVMQVAKRLQTLEKNSDELLGVRLSKLIDDEEFTKQNDRLKNQIRDLRVRQSVLLNPQASTEAAVKYGIQFVREFPTLWPKLLPGELRVMLNLLFPQNLDYHYPEFQTSELSPIYAVESVKTANKTHQVLPEGIEPP